MQRSTSAAAASEMEANARNAVRPNAKAHCRSMFTDTSDALASSSMCAQDCCMAEFPEKPRSRQAWPLSKRANTHIFRGNQLEGDQIWAAETQGWLPITSDHSQFAEACMRTVYICT